MPLTGLQTVEGELQGTESLKEIYQQALIAYLGAEAGYSSIRANAS